MGCSAYVSQRGTPRAHTSIPADGYGATPDRKPALHCLRTRDADERQRSRGVTRSHTAVALRLLHACCMPGGLAQAQLLLYGKTCWGGRLRSVRPRQRRLK